MAVKLKPRSAEAPLSAQQMHPAKFAAEDAIPRAAILR
jgi:hypothetical protein